MELCIQKKHAKYGDSTRCCIRMREHTKIKYTNNSNNWLKRNETKRNILLYVIKPFKASYRTYTLTMWTKPY